MFCSNCGLQIPDGSRFCPNCGREVVVKPVTVASPVNLNLNAGTDYSIVLLGCGNCNAVTACELISDLLGYTEAQAVELMRTAPVEIACSLNAQQAMVLSQAMTEYGLQVSIRNERGYVDFSQAAARSVFSENGSILQDVLNVLGTLTLANRVRRITRWTIDDPFRFIFAPRYRRPAPPRYTRHFRRTPVVTVRRPSRPATRLSARPAAKPVLRHAPQPAPRSVVAPRPAVSPRPAVGPCPSAAPRPATGLRAPVRSRPSAGPAPRSAGELLAKSLLKALTGNPGGRGGRGPGRP